MKTKAAVLRKIGELLEVAELTIPDLKPHQVLVDVAYSGICGSQILEINGGRGPDPHLPHTLGHEGSGIVAKVGPDVIKVKLKDHVVLSWIRGSGIHVPSSIYSSGEIRSGAVSTFMTRAVVSETCVTRIPREMLLREAVLLGCAFATGFGAVTYTAKVKPGSSVAIFGLGGVGLSAVMGAVLAKAKLIIAIDISAESLARAKDLGATSVVNARDIYLESHIAGPRWIGPPHGFDYAIEAAGSSKAMETAFDVIKNDGLCVLAGNLSLGQRISLDPLDFIKGKRIVGTWGGDTYPDRDIPYYVSLYLDGGLPLGKLIGGEYPLEKINGAIAASKTSAGRTLIKM